MEEVELSSTPEFVFKYKMIKRIVTRKKYNNNNYNSMFMEL